jgi:hypothetical protein
LQPELKASRQIDFLFPIIKKKKKKTLPLPAVVTLAREIRLAELEKKRRSAELKRKRQNLKRS